MKPGEAGSQLYPTAGGLAGNSGSPTLQDSEAMQQQLDREPEAPPACTCRTCFAATGRELIPVEAKQGNYFLPDSGFPQNPDIEFAKA